MPLITYIEHSGAKHQVDLEPGVSLMEGAVANNIPGIDADCGGACACATCHVFVDPGWTARLGPCSEKEAAMLEMADGARENSRLACQIRIAADHAGLLVHLPAAQH